MYNYASCLKIVRGVRQTKQKKKKKNKKKKKKKCNLKKIGENKYPDNMHTFGMCSNIM